MTIQLYYRSDDIAVDRYKLAAEHFTDVNQALADVEGFARRNGCLLLDDWYTYQEGELVVWETEAHSCLLNRQRLDLYFRIVVYPDRELVTDLETAD